MKKLSKRQKAAFESGDVAGELPVRATYPLRQAGLTEITPEQVSKLNPSDFEASSNFGKRSMQELRDWMGRHGFPEWGSKPDTRTAEKYAAYLRRQGWTVIPPDGSDSK